MLRRTSIGEQEVVNFIIHKCKETEPNNPYEAQAWLLTGKSVVNKSFPLQLEAYQLERRLKNVDGTAYAFEQLFRRFGNHIREDIGEMTNAVRICTLSKGKETPEQQFLNNVFQALSKETQIEILIQCTEFTPVLFEKCQTMLLLVKLFPDTINQKNGGEMLFTLLSCENSDAYSTFRKLLVVELVPSVLQLSQNLSASPRFITLLNQCIEYYVLVANKQDTLADDRWEKLFQIVDQIGGVLQWTIAPFFRRVSKSAGTNSVESLYHAVQLAIQHRNHYSTSELAYVTVVVFLRCIVSYYELLRNCCPTFGGKAKLVLVEVFSPRPHRNTRVDPALPILTSVSNCASIGGNQSQVIQHFLASVKIWEMVTSLKGVDNLEKEFFEILYSMNSLNLSNWDVFKEFQLDYHTYVGQYFQQDVVNIQNPLKLASMYCSFNNFKSAADYCIKGVETIQNDGGSNGGTPANSQTDKGPFSSFGNSNKEDFSFYSPHIYNTDAKGNFILQRRVHFLSDNRAEILAYATNILIRCFHESLGVVATSSDGRCIGHLITLLQLEWPSPPAELIFNHILEIIKLNASFKYIPFFCDFIIEPDFLETFMAISNHESKTVKLELFPNAVAATSSGRRIGTRGLEKGSKTEFKTSMQRQMLKNGRENLENLICKFLTLNKVDILTCFE